MTATFIPLDEEVRRRVIEACDRCLCVEAGAGTGKTTLMVERVLWLLREGHATIEQIVLISFTEKAALELRARLRDRLEDALLDAPAPDEHARLERALLGLDGAHVETIHAFATSLLREHPLEAELPPGFDVLDEMGATLEFESAWEEWLAEQLAAEPAPLVRALELGLDLARVRWLAERLNDERALLPLEHERAPELDRPALHAAVLADAARLSALATSCTDQTDAAFEQIVDLQRWAGRLRLDESFDRALLSAPELKERVGAITRWQSRTALGEVRAVCVALQARITAAQSGLRERALADLIEWLEAFVLAALNRRRRAGLAEFDDLLIWARDLLRDHASVRAALQQRFRYLIVDEFQDTDPLQAELIALLASEEGAAPAGVVLRAGALTVVGDPKQAIYRFRRADITVYAAMRALIAGDDGPEQITQSFRAVAPLVEWVNRTFAEVIVEDAEQHTQPAYVPIAPAHDAHPGLERPPVVLLLYTSGEGKESATARRRREAAAIAAITWQIVEERWPVRSGDGEPPRVATPADIAVLFPTAVELERYEEAFAAAGVAYRFEGGRLFYQRQEVRDLTACILAIDDPTDELAVVAALKSAAFAVPDEELFLFKRDRGRFNPIEPVPDRHERIVAAFSLLAELHHVRNQSGIGALVEDLLRRTRLAEVSLLRPDGRQAVTNLVKVAEQAHAFDRRSGATFRAFARWLAQNQERTPREVESPPDTEGEPVVRMMTVHAAKGLEFPIVILANLAAERRRAETWIADRARRRVELRLGERDSGWRTAGYEAAEAEEERYAGAEMRRLLYVACTRARDHLVLPVAPAGERSPAGCLLPLLPALADLTHGDIRDGHYVIDAASLDAPSEGGRIQMVRFDGDPAAGLVEREAWLRRAGWPLPPTESAT